MAKKEMFMVKQVVGATDLTLQAKTGESLLIKDVRIYNPVSSYVTLKVDKTVVGYFRTGGNLGNHLPLPMGSAKHSHSIGFNATALSSPATDGIVDAMGVAHTNIGIPNTESGAAVVDNVVKFASIPAVSYEGLLNYLWDRQIFKGYPVAEGETFLITGAAQSGAVQVVIYEKYDAGDITNVMDNGSAALKYFFINYGRVSATITTTGSQLYSVVQSPAEFPDFPYGKTVPAKTKITVHGILASDIADDRGAADTMNSEFIKLIKDRVTLFDDDKNGILMRGIIGVTGTAAVIGRGVSLIGNKSDVSIKPPLMFPSPIDFADGEELNVYITTTAGASQSASGLAVADTEIGVISTVERAG